MKDLKVLNDRSDSKWAHPAMTAQYEAANSGGCLADEKIYNFDIPYEERKEIVNDSIEFVKKLYDLNDESPSIKRAEYYQASGCEEEPETSVEVVVYRPKDADGKKKLPAILEVPGGGLYEAMIELVPEILNTADRLGCVVVCPRYRNTFQAVYPAAMNDCHAAWNWMLANAEMLNIDPKKIILHGLSSGSHLALSLAHRLKRFGQKPRGCVVACAFADSRPMYMTSGIKSSWSGGAQWKASMQYLGMNNVFCYNEPEMYPMYATPEQCVGLCPTFMHIDTEDAGSAACRAYQDKLTAAGVYHELHCWGGSSHGVIMVTSIVAPENPCAQRYSAVINGNIKDCWEYDMSREWVKDMLKDD